MTLTPEQQSDWYEHAPLTGAFAQSLHDLGIPCSNISSLSSFLQTYGARPETRAFGIAIRRLAGAFAHELIWGTLFPYMGWLEKDFPDLFDFGPSQFRPASFDRPYGRTLLGIITEMEHRTEALLQRIEAYLQASASTTTDDERGVLRIEVYSQASLSMTADDEHAILTAIQGATLQLQAALIQMRTVVVNRVTDMCDSQESR